MKKFSRLAAVIPLLLLASVPAFAQDKMTSTATSKVSPSSEKDVRHALVYKIVKEWGPYVKAIYKEDIGLWADRMVPVFRQADTSKLRIAARADTFEAMNNALLGQKSQFTAAAAAGKVAKSLGSTVNDLTYTALPGCILVDTRTVGGAFAAGVIRHYKASGPNFSAQGGSNTNCGIPTTPVSLVLSVSSISPTSNGYFRMWPYSTTMPAASNISYRTNENIQNDIILKMSQGLTQDFSVQSSGGSHLVVNVLGYFSAPFATALNCVNSYNAAATTIPLDSFVNVSDASIQACPAGYTGTNYIWRYTGGLGGLSVWNNDYGSTIGLAHVKYNSTTSFTDLTAVMGRRCCQVPGR